MSTENERLHRVTNREILRKYANKSGLIVGMTSTEIEVIRMGIMFNLSYARRKETRKVLLRRAKLSHKKGPTS